MLTDEQCDEFRRLPLSFNDMVRAIYTAGQKEGAKAERERRGKVMRDDFIPEFIKTADVFDQLDSFAGLPNNWDSYGGVATDKRAIAKAKELLAVLPGGPWQAVPVGGGEVQLELHTEDFGITIFIEASNVELTGPL